MVGSRFFQGVVQKKGEFLSLSKIGKAKVKRTVMLLRKNIQSLNPSPEITDESPE
jgi:hypothetical protein